VLRHRRTTANVSEVTQSLQVRFSAGHPALATPWQNGNSPNGAGLNEKTVVVVVRNALLCPEEGKRANTLQSTYRLFYENPVCHARTKRNAGQNRHIRNKFRTPPRYYLRYRSFSTYNRVSLTNPFPPSSRKNYRNKLNDGFIEKTLIT